MIYINAYNYHFSIGCNCRATNAFRELNLKFKNLFCQLINYDECKVEDIN